MIAFSVACKDRYKTHGKTYNVGRCSVCQTRPVTDALVELISEVDSEVDTTHG